MVCLLFEGHLVNTSFWGNLCTVKRWKGQIQDDVMLLISFVNIHDEECQI